MAASSVGGLSVGESVGDLPRKLHLSNSRSAGALDRHLDHCTVPTMNVWHQI
jgi:hypothetical protein